MLQLTSLDLNRGREEWNSFQSGVSLILCGFGLSPKASFVSKGRGLEKKQEPSQKLANRSVVRYRRADADFKTSAREGKETRQAEV